MQKHDYGAYTLTIREMSRKSQLACTVAFREWLNTIGETDELERVAFISTLILMHTPLQVLRGEEVLSVGTHDLGDGAILTLPLTETCLNETLPASLTGWLINAAAEENAYILNSFLAGLERMIQSLSASA